MDVKSVFLNGDLKEEVYVHQPPGFAIPSKEGKTAYAKRVIELAGLTDCNPALTPMEERLKLSHDSTTEEVDTTQYQHLVGSLRYLAHTWLDLAFSVGYVSRFMQRPMMEHQQAMKRIICYIVGTLDHNLYYPRCPRAAHFVGYSDSDHVGDIDTSKSTSGILFLLGKCLVSWQSVKQ
ncbi:secreted RxLR effector protein 161-like [Miscanthus floridulus]|uniref:secreted RxLR effector protein 161-like n=1 Tax=Miscanthus floridulus TaxID=154761 RepID=UPI00345896D9